MKLLTGLLIVVLSTLATTAAFSRIVIKGHVTDANGNVPAICDAHFGKANTNAKLSTNYRCQRDGSFEIPVPTTGFYSLRVSAPNHEEVAIPLYLDGSTNLVEMTIQLQANQYNSTFGKVTVVGDWNKFAFAGGDTMSFSEGPNDNAIFTDDRIATGDTLSYQVLGISGSRSVNGMQADYYVYDGDGDYRSVLRTQKGQHVRIVFDPSQVKFQANSSLPIVHIENNPFLEKAVHLSMSIATMHKAALTYPINGGQVTASEEKLHALLEFIKGDIEKEKAAGDVLSMQYAAVLLTDQFSMDTTFWKQNARMILSTVPASSPMWSLSPSYVTYLTSNVEKDFGTAYRKQLEANSERSVRAAAFAHEMVLAYYAKDIQEWKRLHGLLKEDYSDEPSAAAALTRYNPYGAVMVGKHVPEFEVTLLGTNEKVSDKTLLGKYYLIDFWATWCGPCVGEMPAIHKAYEKFKGKKGFEIVSFSMDGSETVIAPFRKKWPMPWLNVFIPGVFNADLVKRFEVVGIPDPVLVGPDGIIVATEEDLRGGTLELTLNRFLGERN